jgi:hypothetical protein
MGLRTYLGGRYTTPFNEKGKQKKQRIFGWRSSSSISELSVQSVPLD